MTELTLNRLLSDPHFIDLDISLKKYNVFRSLRIQDYEIRHSKFLGHLLNPNETHGLGAEFLTNFLLCLSNSTGKELNISELDLDLTEIGMEWSSSKGVKNTTESGNNKRLDILIRVPMRYVKDSYYEVAVEMKWRAKQHKGQLVAYTKQLNESGIKPKVSVLLTVGGEDPEQDAVSWQSATYQDVVVPALKNTLHKQSDSTSQKVINTLQDWLDILVEASSQESSQKSAAEVHCEKLLEYKDVLQANARFLTIKYPAAYEKLRSYIEESEDVRGKALKFFKEEIGKNFVTAYSNRTYLRFYPSSAYPFATDIGGFPSAEEGISYPLLWELLVWETDNKIKTRLILTLAKLEEGFSMEERAEIVRVARDEFHKPLWDFTNTTITDNFTRIIRSKWETSNAVQSDVNDKISRLVARAESISTRLEALLANTCLYSAKS